jgi:ABC-type transport system substrate-binding protein
VAIDLTEAYAPFLSALAMPIMKIVPEKMAAKTGGSLDTHPVGTGPFVFHSWQENEITLKANSQYFGGVPDLDEIRFRFYPGEKKDKAFPDFLDGKLEGCPLPGSADIGELSGKGYQVLVRPRLSIMFYGMNTRTAPLDDPELRKALSLALDRDRLAKDVFNSRHLPAQQILPPGMPGYSPQNALAVYDMERAAQHLANSRYPQGKGLPELVIASVSHSDAAKRELEMYRQGLAELGIKLKPLFVESWELFKKGIEEGQYSLYRYALYADIPDPDDLLPGIVEKDATHNFTGYVMPEVDTLIGNARGETDPIKRMSLYREAERMVLEDPPLIPVIFLSTQMVFQPNVRNIDLPATGTTYLSLDKITVTARP